MTNQPVFLFETASAVPKIHIRYRVGIRSRNRHTFPDIFVLHSEQRSILEWLWDVIASPCLRALAFERGTY
jgi:hypothetical protein